MSFTFITLHYLTNAPWSVVLLRPLADKTIQADTADSGEGASELMREPSKLSSSHIFVCYFIR